MKLQAMGMRMATQAAGIILPENVTEATGAVAFMVSAVDGFQA
jgi:hypothetical protein